MDELTTEKMLEIISKPKPRGYYSPRYRAKDIFGVDEKFLKSRRINFLKNEIENENSRLNIDIQYITELNQPEWVKEVIIDSRGIIHRQAKIKSMQSELKNLRSKKTDKTKFDIEEIKKYPIGDIIGCQPVSRSGGRDYYICPLHTEQTGSFVHYKNNNSWYCFGCQRGGDSIALYMELNNVSFAEACRALNS
jgi:hypothetical protein